MARNSKAKQGDRKRHQPKQGPRGDAKARMEKQNKVQETEDEGRPDIDERGRSKGSAA